MFCHANTSTAFERILAKNVKVVLPTWAGVAGYLAV